MAEEDKTQESQAGENTDNAASSEQAAAPVTDGAQDKDKEDLLRVTAEETKELEELIRKGSGAHGMVGILTIIGVLIMGAAFLYYQRYDNYKVKDSYRNFPGYLGWMVENQVRKDRETYYTRKADSEVPQWPSVMYDKVRGDIYVIGGMMLSLALVFSQMEKAKMMRNDLLLYRALAREIEKLRRKVKDQHPEAFKKKAGGESEGNGSDN